MFTLSIAVALAATSSAALPSQATQILHAIQREFPASEVPHVYQLAACESTLRQWDKEGNVIIHVNENGSIDFGAMQVNSLHLAEADKLNLDIVNVIEDNIHMARLIWDNQGYSAWLRCSNKIGLIP